MVTLHVDDALYSSWREQAEAAGLSVEEWLRLRTCEKSLVDEERLVRHADWLARLKSLGKIIPSTKNAVDDSRESIY